MKIRAEIEEDLLSQGFSAENDVFKKQALAARLTRLFGSLSQGTVAILDGRWGTGKSVFARQWQHELRANGIPSIYFDAFAADYIADPFQAVTMAFVKAAKDARGSDEKTYQRFLSAASKATRSLAAPMAKMGVKVLSLGIVGAAELDELSSAAEGLADGLGDVSEKAVEKLLERHADDEATFEALRQSLSTLPSLLANQLKLESNHAQQDEQVPSLVVIIDELDRCRPDFALGTLEALKHFFRADRLHFVLVTNLVQLQSSVASKYGVGDRGAEYLQKFYDFVIHFERSERSGEMTNAGLHADKTLRKIMASGSTQETEEFIGWAVNCINAYQLTLRQAERVVTNLALANLDPAKKGFRPPFLVTFLATMKVLDAEMFGEIKNSRLNFAKLKEFLNRGTWNERLQSSQLLNTIRYFSDPNIGEDDPDFRHIGSALWNFGMHDRLQALAYIANVVLDQDR